VPGSGLLATVVPGAFDAWMLMLRDHGRLPLRTILEPAIHYASAGHPVLPRVSATIAGLAEFFRAEWPTSARTWLPGDKAPAPHSLFCNPDLAATWTRLLAEAETVSGQKAQIEKARAVFAKGFIAEKIDHWMRHACLMDAEGARRKGVLTGQDMADWQADYEPPLSVDYHGWTVWKAGVWSQGPSLLQSLRLLEQTDLAGMGPNSADFVHHVTEAMKLAFADREAYYGDPGATRDHRCGKSGGVGREVVIDKPDFAGVDVLGFDHRKDIVVKIQARRAGQRGIFDGFFVISEDAPLGDASCQK